MKKHFIERRNSNYVTNNITFITMAQTDASELLTGELEYNKTSAVTIAIYQGDLTSALAAQTITFDVTIN